MFEIDPRPFQAALDQAKGDLARARAQLAQAEGQQLQSQAQVAQAEANQGKAQFDVDRYIPLAKAKAITDQELDNAVQANLAAKAQVKAGNAGVVSAKAAIVAAKATIAAAEAMVKTAELNLGFTRISSPIDGIAGIAQAQVGNLVSPTSGALTTVSTVDPIKVYFTPTEQEYLNFNRANPTQSELEAARSKLELELVLVDGTIYSQKGRFYVRDRQVDQKTGALPPSIPGLGSAGGFSFWLQDRSGGSVEFLDQNLRNFIAACRRRPELAGVASQFSADVPQIYADVDRDKVLKQGVAVADVYQTLQAYLGGLFLNQFNRFGRQWRVFLQAEGEERRSDQDIRNYFVRNNEGNMVPLSALVTTRNISGPEYTNRSARS